MPHANEKYVLHYWPMVYKAMDELGLDYEEILLMTLGTIAAWKGNFNITIREYVFHDNTSPNGCSMRHCFDILKLALGKNEDCLKIILAVNSELLRCCLLSRRSRDHPSSTIQLAVSLK